ncbi:hypothetical protein [Salirhabdus sp. Marseille-P4669]|uniref:hypothetical protein n=1 Tax=Salirhabdus sp. Marseille-P4669 TaxID=2042310 RepID=UPI001F1E970B|nr:hypothetical protein [Salirhabdus sp. Marseille-P4669]
MHKVGILDNHDGIEPYERKKKMAHNTLFIKEAHGHHNIQMLEAFLMNLPGIERVLVDTDDGEIKVEFDEEEIQLTHIVQQLETSNFHIE